MVSFKVEAAGSGYDKFLHPHFKGFDVADAATARPPLGYSKRDDVEIPTADFVDDMVLQATLALGCLQPMTFDVRRFVPCEGDMVDRRIRLADGSKEAVHIPSYAICNVEAAKTLLQNYVATPDIFIAGAEGRLMSKVHGLFILIKERQIKDIADGPDILDEHLKHWTYLRLGTGSSDIIGGLGIEKDLFPSSPTFGKRPTPRMMVEQVWRWLTPIRAASDRAFYTHLKKLLDRCDRNDFLVVYVIVFIELYEVGVICRDRYRHSRENSAETMYTLPDYVERIQSAAVGLIAHFHAYKKGCVINLALAEFPCNADLAARFVGEISRLVTDEWSKVPESQQDPQSPYYFVAQMHEENWKPRPIYRAATDKLSQFAE